jgi:hypothetical protein
MSPEERAAINRQNAQKSTGPRTEDGKATSRQNSTKHGLTGSGIVQSPQDAVSVEAKLAHYVDSAHPTNVYEYEFLRRMAIASVRLERSFQAEEGRRKLRRSRVTKRFQNMLKRSADAAREVWKENTAVGHAQLTSTSAGCRWLVGEWRTLEQKITHGAWSYKDLTYAIALYGVDPKARMPRDHASYLMRTWSLSLRAYWTEGEGDDTLKLSTVDLHETNARIAKHKEYLIPVDEARRNLVSAIRRTIAILEEREAFLTGEVEASDLEERLDAAEVDTSSAGMRFARYDAMNEAAVHKNWNAFVRVRTLGETKLGLAPGKDPAQNEAIEEKATPVEEHTCDSSGESIELPATVSVGVLRVVSELAEGEMEVVDSASAGREPPSTTSEGV